MNSDELKIVVEQPLDWVGAVLIPVAAVLVSALIAVGLATLERRAARRDRLHALLSEMLSQLNNIASSRTDARSDEEVSLMVTDFVSNLNKLEMMLPRKDWPLPDFLGVTLIASKAVSRDSLGHMSGWLMQVIFAWSRGQLKSKRIAQHLDVDTRPLHPDVDPSEWQYRLKNATSPPARTPPKFYSGRA